MLAPVHRRRGPVNSMVHKTTVTADKMMTAAHSTSSVAVASDSENHRPYGHLVMGGGPGPPLSLEKITATRSLLLLLGMPINRAFLLTLRVQQTSPRRVRP